MDTAERSAPADQWAVAVAMAAAVWSLPAAAQDGGKAIERIPVWLLPADYPAVERQPTLANSAASSRRRLAPGLAFLNQRAGPQAERSIEGQGLRLRAGDGYGLVETSLGLGPHTGLWGEHLLAAADPPADALDRPPPAAAASRAAALAGHPGSAAWHAYGGEDLAAGPAIPIISHEAARRAGTWRILPPYRWLDRLKTEFALDWTVFQDPALTAGIQPLIADPALRAAGEDEMRWRRSFFGTPQLIQPAAVGQRNRTILSNTLLQARISATYTLPPTAWWDSATWVAEIGRQRRTGIPRSAEALDPPGRYRQNRGVQLVFTPAWSQVLPNLDIGLPVAISFSPRGQSPLPGFDGIYKGAKLSLGVAAVYQKAWNIDLRYMHFFRPETSQGLPDRDFITLFVHRSF